MEPRSLLNAMCLVFRPLFGVGVKRCQQETTYRNEIPMQNFTGFCLVGVSHGEVSDSQGHSGCATS